jgi:hypothetical protein
MRKEPLTALGFKADELEPAQAFEVQKQMHTDQPSSKETTGFVAGLRRRRNEK